MYTSKQRLLAAHGRLLLRKDKTLLLGGLLPASLDVASLLLPARACCLCGCSSDSLTAAHTASWLKPAREQLSGHATLHLAQGAKREMPYVYIKGRHVRFIHLPGSLEPAAAVEAHRKRVAAAVKEHERAQAQAAQRPGARLAKGTQLELGRQQAQQTQQQQQQQQQAGPTGMDMG